MERITPLDIHNQQFRVRFRGFDIREVDRFLDTVARQLEERIAENDRLKEAVAALETRVSELERNAGDTQRREIEELEASRDALLGEAKKAAEEILESSRREVESLRGEVERLEQMKRSLDEYFEYFLYFNEKVLQSWQKSRKKTEETE
ncbi:MAG TPA: DivIVA domain-containing protein [Syntrophales bacterium]|nr:DivIVA domain-containing protein [Syntrophales bacterium]HQB31027.1 DivIVA domain-containing protein [Syntrophales bacterium]